MSRLSAPWLATAPRQAAVVVFVNDPEHAPSADEMLVRSHLDLTPAEGRVVSALARGLSPADVARSTGLSLHTVRTH